MYSNGVDLEGVVNDSYAFLSDIPDGTLPRGARPPTKAGSWTNRSTKTDSLRSKGLQPRFRSVHELQEFEAQKRNEEVIYSQPMRRANENPPSKGKPMKSFGSQEVIYTQPIRREEINYSEIDFSHHRQQGPGSVRNEEVLYSQPLGKKSPGSVRSEEVLYSRPVAQNSSGSLRSDRPVSEIRHEKIHWHVDEKKNIDEWQANLQAQNSTNQGSSLLRRTNNYLSAIQKMKNDDSSVPSQSNSPSGAESQGTATQKDEDNQKSLAERYEDLQKSSIPPPPPPPPPMPSTTGVFPLNKVTRTDSKKLAAGPPKRAVPEKPELPWLSDVKRGREGLRATQPRPDKGLRRTETDVPENLTFQEKLERIVGAQAAAIRWHNSAKPPLVPPVLEANRDIMPEKKEPVKPQPPPKTMGKDTTKKALTKIFANGPPPPPPRQRASMRDTFDMDEKRKQNIARLRAIERQTREEGPEEGVINVEVPKMWVNRPEQESHRQMMGDVFANIKNRGSGISYA